MRILKRSFLFTHVRDPFSFLRVCFCSICKSNVRKFPVSVRILDKWYGYSYCLLALQREDCRTIDHTALTTGVRVASCVEVSVKSGEDSVGNLRES